VFDILGEGDHMAKVNIIGTIPELLNVKFLCYGCGCQNIPDFRKEWLCQNMCCCLHSYCGFIELMETQIFCLGPCSSPELNFTFQLPVSIQL
jgi:hypothetical protein